MNGIIFTVFFFFSSRRRHTRCSRDWSSDVCSSDLARPEGAELERVIVGRLLLVAQGFVNRKLEDEVGLRMAAVREGCTYLQARMRLLEFLDADAASLDRKSTRLNSSHGYISYAVFCLKKKKKTSERSSTAKK